MPRASHICRLGATVAGLDVARGCHDGAGGRHSGPFRWTCKQSPQWTNDDTWADVTQKRPLRWELATGERRETMGGSFGHIGA